MAIIEKRELVRKWASALWLKQKTTGRLVLAAAILITVRRLDLEIMDTVVINEIRVYYKFIDYKFR